VVGLSVLLIAKEPDLGTAIVLSFSVCVLLLAARKPRTLALADAIIVVGDHGRDAPVPGGQARLPSSRQ
jgi:cell division protein FtsW (lipid II flippase)